MEERSFVTEKVLAEFAKRVDQEDKRQNERIDRLENTLQTMSTIAISVERLAVNMETLAKEVARQGTKLNDLEMKPAKRWDLLISSVISSIVGLILGFVFSGIFA